MSLFEGLFAANFMPHAMCLRGSGVIFLNVASDAFIAFAYMLIPFALGKFIRQRKELEFSWLFVLFALFILGCGCTHILSIWTLWVPIYRFEGLIKALTALVSIATAIALLRSIPQLMALPSPSQLQVEIENRTAAQQEVLRLNHDLEQRVVHRTRELVEANRVLRENREALKAINQRLDIALSAGFVSIWECDLARQVVRWDELSRGFGAFPETLEVSCQQFLEYIDQDDRERVKRALFAVADGQSSRYGVEYRMYRPNTGEIRFFKATAHVSQQEPSKDGSGITLLGTTVDITAEKTAEEALVKAVDDLRQFAYAAAHDLQEPLRNISISAQLLDLEWADRWDEHSRGLISQAVDGSQRVHQMIRDLLAYTRAVNESKPLQVRTSAECALKEALANLSNAIQQSRMQVLHDPLPDVQVSGIHMLQLFQNILGNAVKYRRPGTEPKVAISATRKGSRWLFRVSDNGIGFDQAYAHRIFGIFKRLHQRDEYEGNGIGLAICARIVNHYGGQIWAEGIAGEGASFFFSLPA